MREVKKTVLTPKSPLVVAVVGAPGAGKSFFAEQFANAIGLAIASQDHVRWMLFAKHTYSRNENDIVNQVVGMLVDQLFKTKRSFVIDGGCNAAVERQRLKTQCRQAGYKLLFVTVQTDLPTAKHRAMHRTADHGLANYNQDLTPELFKQLLAKYQAPIVDNITTIAISGKYNFNAQARSVLKHIFATNQAWSNGSSH